MEWNTSGIITGALLFVGGYSLGRVVKTLEMAREAHARWAPDPGIDEATIEAAVRAKNKVEAIRLYRLRTGAGLKDAKRAVEALAQRINVRF
jgi:ribosomal protein L7/L12